MKKTACIFLLLSLLTGCSMEPLSEYFGQAEAVVSQAVAILPSPSPTPSPLVVSAQESLLWARQQLSPAGQESYDLLSTAIACRQETGVDVTVPSSEVPLVLTALTMDHPEYFWFDGQASYVTTAIPMVGERVSVTLSYTLTEDAIRAGQEAVDQYAAACFAQITDAQTDYDKIISVYRYIIANTDYVLSAIDQSLLSVMTTGQGTCAGYSRCFQYLMHQLDIPCTLALGYGAGGESHGWNVVFCGGQWYHVDVTWGDPVDQYGQPGDSLEYSFCMLTDEEIYRTHRADAEIPLPICTATEYNYFRQAGLQMAMWDMADYEARLSGAISRGETWFTVRFDRQEDYSAAVSALIDEAGIMDAFGRCGIPIPPEGVTYSCGDEALEFSVQISY